MNSLTQPTAKVVPLAPPADAAAHAVPLSSALIANTNSTEVPGSKATRSGLFPIALAAILLLFGVSDLALEAVGYRYLGTGGPFYQKLHPSTFIIAGAMLFMIMRHRQPLNDLLRIIHDWSGASLFLTFVMVLQAVILLKGYPLTYAIDTFLIPVLLFFLLVQLTAEERHKLAYVVLAIFAANTAVGFGEYISGERILSLEGGSDVAEKIADSLDWRPTAIFGHPLRNSFLTGLCVLVLLLTSLPLRARMLFLAVQLIAMLLFGGRSSMVIIVALMLVMAAIALFRVLLGARFGITAIPKVMGGLITMIGLVFVLISSGALDKVIERFEWDESAETRVSAIRMFEQFETADVLLGISQSRKEALQVIYDTQFGIEIFWLAFLMDYGLIMLAAFAIALGFLMRDYIRATAPHAGWLIAFFLIGISASLGISAKGVLLTQFTALVLLFCRASRPQSSNQHAA